MRSLPQGRGETPNKGWTQLLVLAEGSGDFHLANFGHPAAATPPGALASVDVAAQPYMWYTYLAHKKSLWIVHSEGAPRPATVPRLEDLRKTLSQCGPPGPRGKYLGCSCARPYTRSRPYPPPPPTRTLRYRTWSTPHTL